MTKCLWTGALCVQAKSEKYKGPPKASTECYQGTPTWTCTLTVCQPLGYRISSASNACSSSLSLLVCLSSRIQLKHHLLCNLLPSELLMLSFAFSTALLSSNTWGHVSCTTFFKGVDQVFVLPAGQCLRTFRAHMAGMKLSQCINLNKLKSAWLERKERRDEKEKKKTDHQLLHLVN